MELTINLKEPHLKQQGFIDSSALRKVICAGRRSGKTTGVSNLSIEKFLNGERVLYAAPTQEQIDRYWTEVKTALSEPIQAGIFYKNETRHIIELPGTEQRIRAKTAWDADTLRGDYANVLILEEYSMMDSSAWEQVGVPMLLDTNGIAVFIFTPKRKNHAWQLYQRAISDTTGRWQAWHFTSHDNPYLSKEALEEITQDMTEDSYRQEILAQFLDSEGQVFRNITNCLNAPKDSTPEQHKDHNIVAGLDLAKSQDFTAISIVCADCKVEIAKDRFNQIDYIYQMQRIKAICQKWGVNYLLADETGVGSPIVEQLRRDLTTSTDGFVITAASKSPLIESLALCFEREECQWLSDAIWTGELESYEVRTSANTGRPTYSTPSGIHDDTVIARALAWKATMDNTFRILIGGA